MRRTAVAVAMVAALWAAACTPTTTVTATPSTTKPACKAITTVAGKVTPAGTVRQATLEIQKNGKWGEFEWFETASDTLGTIVVPVSKTTGAYSLTYIAPNNALPATIRLRVHVVYGKTVDAVSTSWYVTRPTCP